MTFIKLYLVSLLVFAGLDFVWLGFIAKNIYKDQIGFLMTDTVRWGAAVAFYLLYLFGLTLFATLPSLRLNSLSMALFYGAVFGLVCYATYDLTNLATIKGWPVKIVCYDLLWGAFISAATTGITYWIATHWKTHFSI
jgi:uncharacterized membrane protein